MLTFHGVECAFSLSLENDHLPLILQVVHVENVFSDTSLSPAHVEVTFLDGCHRSPMILARRLSDLGSKLRIGDIVMLTNDISQRLDDNKVVIICLDITLMDHSVDIIGDPMDFVMVSEITEPIVFIGNSVTGFLVNVSRIPVIGSCWVLQLWIELEQPKVLMQEVVVRTLTRNAALNHTRCILVQSSVILVRVTEYSCHLV
jgi:hypothetical protein